MNLLCRFISIAYITVRSYDTSFVKAMFFIVIDVTEQSEMYVACGIV